MIKDLEDLKDKVIILDYPGGPYIPSQVRQWEITHTEEKVV